MKQLNTIPTPGRVVGRYLAQPGPNERGTLPDKYPEDQN
jgi:hypothetical protein